MQIRGEEFLLINGWMNYLSLLLAACLGRRRFRPVRAWAASGLGAAYAVMAWMAGRSWRGAAPLAAVGLMMAGITFGRDALRMLPLTAAGGWLLAGGAAWMLRQGVPTGAVMLLCGALTGMICLLARRRGALGGQDAALRLTLNGKTVTIPALRDSGNLLRDGVTALPVIAVPASRARPLLPKGVAPGNIATLPRGWRLIRVKTASGEKTLMCFRPDAAVIVAGKKEWRADAAVMLTDMPGACALVPEALMEKAGHAREG